MISAAQKTAAATLTTGSSKFSISERLFKRKKSFAGQVVIVTGASSGIGAATAEAFAQRGAIVVLAARTADRLTQLKEKIEREGGIASVQQTDVTDPNACRMLIESTLARLGRIDVLVNNAGVSVKTMVSECTLDTVKRVMEINFFGAVACTLAALPALQKSRGVIVGVSSITGLVGIPQRAPYSASKFAMRGFFDALRCEIASAGMQVFMVYPGFVRSAIRENALSGNGAVTKEPSSAFGAIMEPEDVAYTIVQGVYSRRREATICRKTASFIAVLSWLPSTARDGLLRKLMIKKVQVLQEDPPV